MQDLCRRFCGCLNLLRCPNQCFLVTQGDADPLSFSMVFSLRHYICGRASQLFPEIFAEIRGCCEANRDRRKTQKLMQRIASKLGQIYQQIGRLAHGLTEYAEMVDLPILNDKGSADSDRISHSADFSSTPRGPYHTFSTAALDFITAPLVKAAKLGRWNCLISI